MPKLNLTVVCKGCGREFEAPLKVDRRSFEKGTLAANYHTCPHCGERRTYRKADYTVKDGNEGMGERGNETNMGSV